MTVMAKDRKSKDETTIDQLCDNCGQVFSAFLNQMEEQNAKVVCPACGTEHSAGHAHIPAKAGRAKKR